MHAQSGVKYFQYFDGLCGANSCNWAACGWGLPPHLVEGYQALLLGRDERAFLLRPRDDALQGVLDLLAPDLGQACVTGGA